MKKKIVLAVVLAAAGCGSKKAAVDCDAEIGKGIERYTTTAKAHNAGARAQAMADAFKEALTERCKADKWTPEAVACFANLTNVRDIQNCRNQLPADQQTRLDNELKEALQSRLGAGMGQRMPPMPGHPSTLTGSNGGSGAPGAAAGSGAAPSGEAAPAGSGAAAPAPSGSPPAPAAPSGSPAPSGGSAAK